MFRLVLFYTISFHYYSNRCFTDEVQSSHILTPSPFIIHHAWPFIPHTFPHTFPHLPSPTITNTLNFTLTPHLYPHPWNPDKQGVSAGKWGCEGKKRKKLFLLYRYLNGENTPSEAMGYSYHCRKLQRAECNNEYLTGIMGDTMTRSEETSGIKELEKFHSLMNRKRRASGETL